MSEFLGKLNEALKSFAQGWAGNATIASLVLYVLGYISLRFHLTTFGIPADLEIVDERYVFQGAKFLVFFLPIFPSLMVLVLAVALPVRLIGRLLSCWTPESLRKRSGGFLTRVCQLTERPNLLLLSSSVISLVMIQKVMRLCFDFHDLLLTRTLEGSGLLRGVLLDPDGLSTGIYFVFLLAGTTVPAALWWRASRLASTAPTSVALRTLSAVLILLQVLLLPANYGVLVADKGVSKVRSVPTRQAPLKETEAAWLVWRGKEWTTYLVRDTASGRDDRVLLTVRSAEVTTIEASAYDRILPVLFGTPEHLAAPSGSTSGQEGISK